MVKSALLCSAMIFAGVSTGQTSIASAQSAPAPAHRLEFDAVSVRPGRQFVIIGYDFLDPTSKMAPPAGGLFSWNMPLGNLIRFAYDIRQPQVARQAMEGLPKWTQNEWFAIEARAEGNPTRDEVRQMVRSMLEDRFHFAAHLEKREGDVLALIVDKPGLLKPHTGGDACTLPSSVTDSKRYPHAYPPYDGWVIRCGVFNRELSHSGERRLEMLDVTIDQIAGALSAMEPAPVIDQTQLAGHYDAVLDFAPPIPPSAEASEDAVGAPQLSTALEKQLGLKLVKQRAQVDIFVIDHIQPPTEN